MKNSVSKLRLFVAVNLNADMLTSLRRTADCLKAQSAGGVFTKDNNFHITIAFIGETDRIDEAKRAVGETVFSPFEISLGKIGKFPREGGDIYYASVEGEGLSALAYETATRLRNEGFAIESRAFTPHITLGRRVSIKSSASIEAAPSSMTVSRISLMKSERSKTDGELRYEEIYYKEV